MKPPRSSRNPPRPNRAPPRANRVSRRPDRVSPRPSIGMGVPRLAALRAWVLLLLAAAPILAGFGACATPAAAAAGEGESNWAGYVSKGRETRFTNVSATWVQPAVSCTGGRSTYMSSWVGLGGDTSTTLEQIGTEADCESDGQATYSSWFELYPRVSETPKLTIRPGDVVSASVTVTGRDVRLSMTNQTLGTRFDRSLHADQLDVSSAEWIVEAPSLCLTASTASCRDSVLSNFGSIRFTRARASTAGQAGGVTGADWSGTPYTLAIGATGATATRASEARPSGSRAVTGALSGREDTFGVTFAAKLPVSTRPEAR
jgi:hypothetical protein